MAAWVLIFLLAPVEALGGSTFHASRARDRVEASQAVPFAAEVFSDAAHGSSPPERSQVELLRFVTAYRTGLEAVVDATPYSPLLRAAASDAASAAASALAANKSSAGASGKESLTFYAFIDTWVNNETGHDVLYLDNVTGMCTPLRKSDGNGWTMQLDLLLWPRTSVDTRPRESVTLASGYYGANYRFGDISFVEGSVVDNGTRLEVDSSVDFADVVGSPPVFECPHGPGDLQQPSLLGYAAEQAAFLSNRHGQDSHEVRLFAQDLFQLLAYPVLMPLNVTAVFNATSSVLAHFDPAVQQPEVGMPVFYEELDVYTDTELSTMWLNSTYPFNASGKVTEVYNDTMVVSLQHPCLPRGQHFDLPRLLIAKNSTQMAEQQAVVDRVMRWGNSSEGEARVVNMLSHGVQHALSEPLILEGEALTPPPALGRLKPSSAVLVPNSTRQSFALTSAVSSLDANGTRSCVVRRHRQGRLFSRKFQLASLFPGDRVVLQLTVTGHGWAMTTEQCGEYCHAVYHLNFNGQSAANVTQFRDDCPQNPINGSMQYGTWDEHRNGWCPGTVEPGFFMDVTDWMKEGTNSLNFDVVVWSNRTGLYEPYTDFAGFAYGDQASLIVGLSLLVYSAQATAAVHAAGRPQSAAEAALLHGSSAPEALRPRRLSQAAAAFSLLSEVPEPVELREKRQRRRALSSPLGGFERLLKAVSLTADTAGANDVYGKDHSTNGVNGFDFEARAPWYLYSQSREGYPGLDSGAVSVPIFSGALLQGNSRNVEAHVDPMRLAAVDWGQAALYLRLTKPPGDLEYDHWDRVGSVGMFVDGNRVRGGTP